MKSVVLLTNDYSENELKENYNYYSAYMREIDEDARPFNDEWIADEYDMSYNDFFDNLKYSENNSTCVVIGSLGLWSGVHDIIPTVFNTLSDAIKKCIGNNDYFTVKQNNGHIEVASIHHDGTNNYSIYLLNEKGKNLGMVNDEKLRSHYYHKKIKGYVF